ncbi:MAG: molecular chaperone TorD family protein [Betaproteobacteria bacterium]|nr:molecular chaperone TorD family protein [Betaproteobacteria bacterium]
METVLARVEVQRLVAAEEAARADFYALLATLFHHAPDGKLLRTLSLAPPMEGGDERLARAWGQLVAASGAMDPVAAAEEYETLFVGMGKAKVSVYAAYYFDGASAVDHPRVRIIEDLAALGLARSPGACEPEDHFAGLFDAMRVLVAGGAGRAPASIAQQRRFYETHLKPVAGRFLAAVQDAPDSNYYRRVAAVGEAFVGIEDESFNLD